MRIAFMGTPQFAADILNDISDHFDIVCVYTAPDKVRSRGKTTSPSPVKLVATNLGLDVCTPSSLKSPEEISKLQQLELDAIVVAAYGMILPKEVLDIPRLGCINVHASLLPRWRGAAPIERAILAGDENIGVCVMQMEEGLDTGDYCISRSIPLDSMDAQKATSELASLGASAVITALNQIDDGHAFWTAQDENEVTYANKIAKGELNINPNLTVSEACRMVRASSDPHPSKCKISNRGVTIVELVPAEISIDEDKLNGNNNVVFNAKKLYLQFVDGFAEVRSLKPDGKALMDAKSFVAGMPEIRENKATWSGIDG